MSLSRSVRRIRARKASVSVFFSLILLVALAAASTLSGSSREPAQSRKLPPQHLQRSNLPKLPRQLRLPCGDDRLRPEKRAWALSSADFVLDPNGTSHIAWPFVRNDWTVVTGSEFHVGDDYYADDWNRGIGDQDEGLIALAPAPGYVIFAGRNAAGQSFDAYGNQVVVQIVDQSGERTGFAYRYAHLKSIAVELNDYVYFGSEIGTVGGTGANDNSFSPHLHSVLYKNIHDTASSSTRTGLENLQLGYSPSAFVTGPPSIFAAEFENDATPFFYDPENLPCSTWNGDVEACDAHSIPYGGNYTQDCAYYFCSGLCLPRGTSNCRAGCPDTEGPNPVACDVRDEDDSDESLPCHTWNGDLDACNEHSILFGDEQTRDCAFYTVTNKCRPRGTSNCLAGFRLYCEP